MIHASDPEAAEAYLSDAFGEDLITPAAVIDEMLTDYRDGIVATFVTLAVLLVLMCLCIFGIMRSSFMGRVKEVGVLRAIGVSKRNLVFRFAVESALLMVLTVLLGYFLSSWFIVSLSDAPLFSSVFYFPAWLGIAMLVIVAAAGLFFGILPAILLLRKTPSEILAKYDV
jgi:ABC-type antimicrobial peptide transport system permease subunit